MCGFDFNLTCPAREPRRQGLSRWFQPIWPAANVLGCLAVAGLLLVAAPASAQLQVTVPIPIDPGAGSDTLRDVAPKVQTDGRGTWIMIWEKIEPNAPAPVGRGIFASRSSNNGVSWSVPVELALGAVPPSNGPVLSPDGCGNWLAVWSSTDPLGSELGTDTDILFSTSSDNGLTWTPPAALNAHAVADSAEDRDAAPRAVATGCNSWLVGWVSNYDPLGATGPDEEVFIARTEDMGAHWSEPEVLNTNAADDWVDDRELFPGFIDTGQDGSPELVSDGHGTVIAVWSTDADLGGTTGTDGDFVYARSVDNGLTWSEMAPLSSRAAVDSTQEGSFRLETDTRGVWIAIWDTHDTVGDTTGTDHDILYTRSVDNGVTWSPTTPLNSNAGSDDRMEDQNVALATDRWGRWIAVWRTKDVVGTASTPFGTDWDLQLTYSTNNGATWSAPAPVFSNAMTDEMDDHQPVLAADGRGNWLLAWSRFEGPFLEFGPAPDADVVISRFTLSTVSLGGDPERASVSGPWSIIE